MASVEQLERKILELENKIKASMEITSQLQRESKKALDTAMHAYKLDAYGYLWAYDAETKTYHKTEMRVATPEIADKMVKTRCLADGAVTSEKIEDRAVGSRQMHDGCVEGRHIQNGAIELKHFAEKTIPAEKLKDQSITGDNINDDIPNGKLANNAVSTRNIQDGAVKPEKIDPYLLQLIYSGGKHGIAVSNEFGTDEYISVSQKTLTDALNKIWTKLEDITGEPYSGITMTVTPDYFISEEGCTVHVTAKTTEANGTFEKIQFFINGTLVVEAENKDYFETDIEITETSVLKCVAKVMGVEYTREKLITHYNSFWLGAGTTYEDIMNVEHVIPITNGMRGAYNVTCADSDNIFVVMSKGLRPGFIRADMNSFEIPFDETTVTINDEEYSVFTSRNAYEAGTYNIDING